MTQHHAHKPHTISARNANTALHDGLWWLAMAGNLEESRNGPALVAPGPVITHYTRPQERVLFAPMRDANPFFHLYESMWMLAGRNDSAAVAQYAKTMEMFADNGVLNGAYGYRWRNHFGVDQLRLVAAELRNNKASRRVVLEMWDPGHYGSGGDLESAMAGSKDVPCNTHVYFGIDKVGLNMTVCNRSNDMIWGGYGANYVHMGVLQEVLAAAIGVPVGSYYQMSNNFHVYPERADTKRLIYQEGTIPRFNVAYTPDDRYDLGLASLSYIPMFSEPTDLSRVLATADRLAENPVRTDPADSLWLRNVWAPMMEAHLAHKNGETLWGITYLRGFGVGTNDWLTAGSEWLERRLSTQRREGGNAQAA